MIGNVINYSVVQFLPYPETGEFVNVGIVLICPQLGRFEFHVKAGRTRRVQDFFPEMNHALYEQGTKQLGAELKRIRALVDVDRRERQMVLPAEQQRLMSLFSEVIRKRESLFRFSAPATVMAEDPSVELERLFDDYVRRQFARTVEYQETIMKRRLQELFRARDLMRLYREETIGDENYHVKFPFYRAASDVHATDCAIKPLALAHQDSTKIVEHGDVWLARVRRLRDMNKLPHDVLFVVRPPESGSAETRERACREIRQELERLDTRTLAQDAETDILAFAGKN